MRSLLLLQLLGACSEGALSKGPDDSAGGGLDTGQYDGEDSAADTADTGGALVPAWYTVRATLAVVKGAPVTEGAAVSIVVVSEDAVTPACEVPLATTSLAVDDAPVEEISYWWSLDVEAKEAPCATLPRAIELGIGVLGADVLAQLGAQGLDDVAGSLYGAYLREQGGEVYIYGWAGTESDVAGDTAATVPPPDGVYTLAPVFLLRLP